MEKMFLLTDCENTPFAILKSGDETQLNEAIKEQFSFVAVKLTMDLKEPDWGVSETIKFIGTDEDGDTENHEVSWTALVSY